MCFLDDTDATEAPQLVSMRVIHHRSFKSVTTDTFSERKAQMGKPHHAGMGAFPPPAYHTGGAYCTGLQLSVNTATSWRMSGYGTEVDMHYLGTNA